MKKVRKSVVFVSNFLLIAVFVGGCTKETPQNEQPKFELERRALVSTSEQYLFASSTGEMSRTAEVSSPFSFSENKRVKIAFDEKTLRILEVEKDARFRANGTNDKLVLAIPVKHVSYKCQTDSYNECTNNEVEDTSKPWYEKDFFKVEFADVRTGQLDFLPINFETNFLGESCFSEVSSRVTEAKIDGDSLNFTVEKSFRVGILCLNQLEELADTNVTARFHYSMVKASSITSSDFISVSYPEKDQNTFGFFSTQRTPLDSTNNATESGRISLMNHWNPKRSEIVYHLSDNFYKPENAKILALTKQTVSTLNEGLAKSEVKFRIRLSEERGRNPGDIRNSMIVLVEDPVAAGLLGYGPQTEDPLTGEIVSARTVMFLGTATQIVRRTYEQLLEERARITHISNISSAVSMVRPNFSDKQNLANSSSSLISSNKIRSIERELKQYTRHDNRLYASDDLQSQFRYLHEVKNCSFSLPNEGALSAISPQLKSALSEFTVPWESLNAAQQRQVAEIIIPVIWVPTLIHELGHNLGLRHNFQGSEDKVNFYTDTELHALGIDHQTPSSTVMEYVEDIHALPALGKYDLAALRFGYKRQVELADGQFVTINSTLEGDQQLASAQLKEFGFCTDEHAGINAGCRRFDLGTSYTEIAEHLIAQYKSAYRERNLRRDRANFSLMDDAIYARRIARVFQEMRLMLEVTERIKGLGIPYDHSLWNEEPFLKDLMAASVLTGELMMSVLGSPDLTCAIASASAPETIVAAQGLAQFTTKKASCFDLHDELNPDFVVVGEYGRSVQSLKLETSKNAYVDQIDVRGVWADKLMAMRTLFQRQIGSHNLDVQGADNYADLPQLRGKLLELSMGMAINQHAQNEELRFADGGTQEMILPVETYDSFVLPQSISPRIARLLQIPEQESRLIDLIVKEIPALMVSHPSKKESEKEFADAFRVGMINPILQTANIPESYKKLPLGDEELFYASPKNILALALIELREKAQSEDPTTSVSFFDSLLRALPVR